MDVKTASVALAMSEYYVAAVVADYGERDFRRQEYGAWYVAHTDTAMLTQEAIQKQYGIFVTYPQQDYEDVYLDSFFDWLENQELGYVVLRTAHEGYVVLPVSEFEHTDS